MHYGAISGENIGLSIVLDKNLSENIEKKKVEEKKTEKDFEFKSNPNTTKHNDELFRKTSLKKNKDYKVVVQTVQNDNKTYELNSSFESKYINSAEYKKSLNSFINLKDNNGHTAIHIAVLNNNLNGIKTFIEYGASVFIRDNQEKVYMFIMLVACEFSK